MSYPGSSRIKLASMCFWLCVRGGFLAAGLTCCLLASPIALAGQPAPRSLLIFDQSTSFRPWPSAIISWIQAVIREDAGAPISIYVEHLDLYRFKGARYENSLQDHFREKYRDKPIGVIVVIGPSTLEYVMRLRTTLWATVPIVFAAVDVKTATSELPPLVTGTAVPMTLADMIKAARTLVPDLERFAIVGDRFEYQPYFRHFAEELPFFSRELEFVDLMGLSVREVRQRAAALPDRTAILYIGINFDFEGTYIAADVLPLVAEAANQPIIVGVETFLGSGAIGGFIMSPGHIGRDAGRLALRILNGESASKIPVTTGDSLTPIFDWRQLQRWNISEDRLPPGSEVRFREPRLWGQHRDLVVAAVAALLLQAALITWLLLEHRRRHKAEIAVRNIMSELYQMNRLAGAGELSASIAHEVNQPLTGIVTKANAALRWLKSETPDIEKARAALSQIVSAGHRASGIIVSVRAMFKRDTQDRIPVDINKLILTVLRIVRIDLRRHEIELQTEFNEPLAKVIGNPVQLQQVILNLVMNAIESMHSVQRRVLRVETHSSGSNAVRVSIEDTGTGIDPSHLNRIFKPLFSTKERGMGMGLSICHSIIECHDGRIWVSAGSNGGSRFQFELPNRGNGR